MAARTLKMRNYKLNYDGDTVVAALSKESYEGYIREERSAQYKVYREFQYGIMSHYTLPSFDKLMRNTDGVFPIAVTPVDGVIGS